MNIMKFRPLFYILSGCLLLTSLFSFIFWGFKTSIDFSGGSNWVMTLPSKPNQDSINNVFKENNLDSPEINTTDQTYTLKFKNIDPEKKDQLVASVTKIDSQYKELKFESLGPVLGKELLRKTIFAIVLSAIALLIFIGTRFKDFSFGTAAVLAMIHDAIILIGSFSLFGHFFGAEVDSLFVTALLTTLSASVHDTVVTFNRIKELKLQNYRIDWVQLANEAVTETLSRSLNNSMTIIFMLLALVVLGGSTTHWFATALLVGVICGTYSSIGVAIPLVLFFKRDKKKK